MNPRRTDDEVQVPGANRQRVNPLIELVDTSSA
jgi:hypothetical protein